MPTPRMPDGGSSRSAARSSRPSDGSPTLPLRQKPQLEGSVLSAATGLPSVPGYQLLRILGNGGMSTVYLARQQKLKREVAIKMIRREDWDDLQLRERFRREAESIAALEHPNVVQIFEVGEAAGMPFLALEYVAGGTLAKRIDGEPLSPKLAARIASQLADAVQAAHDQDIIHRDLKPANILLASAKFRSDAPTTEATPIASNSVEAADRLRPKISDFGLARFLSDDNRQTRSGFAIGTPSYMAPEQAAGRPDEVGKPADIYGLGAILYEMLTGRPPFESESAIQTVWKVRHEEPTPPGQVNPDLPRDLETICLKCLDKDPHRRYASADELRRDLERFLANRPVKARPVSIPVRLAKWARRRPTTAVAIGLSSLLVIALVVSIAIIQRMNARLKQNSPAAESRDVEKRNGNPNLDELNLTLGPRQSSAGMSTQEKIDYANQYPGDCNAQLWAYDALTAENRHAEARTFIDRARALVEDPRTRRGGMNGPGDEDAETAEVFERWGDHCTFRNDFNGAWQAHQEALKRRRQLAEQQPGQRRWILAVGVSLAKVARLHMSRSNRDDDQSAVALMKQRLELIEPLSDAFDRAESLLETHNLLAELYWRMSEPRLSDKHAMSAEDLNQRFFQGRGPRFLPQKKGGPGGKK